MLRTVTLRLFLLLLVVLVHGALLRAQVGPDDDGEFSPGKEFMAGDTIRGDLDLCTSDPAQFDKVDYFFSALPEDGTITIIATFTYTGVVTDNVSPIASFSMSGTPGGGGGFGGGVLTTGTASDTATLACVAIDTAYLQVSTNACFSYELTYFITPPATTADPLENDNFDAATLLTVGEQQEGHIGFRRFGSAIDRADGRDYYKTVLPDDGTLRVYVDLLPSDEFDFFSLLTSVYGGDRRLIGSQQLQELDNSLPLASDTLTFSCLARDTIYVVVESASCYGYRLRYELEPSPTAADPETNDLATAAVLVDSSFTGRIGYVSRGREDRTDFFKTALPDSGRFDLVFDYQNTSDAAATAPFIAVFAADGTNLGINVTPQIESGASGRDTLSIVGTPGDSLSIRITTNTCFAYTGTFLFPDIGTANRAYERLRGVSFSPNPVRNGLLQLRSTTPLHRAEVGLFDLLGRQVVKQQVDIGPGQNLEIPVSKLIEGIYLIRVMTADRKIWTDKVVVTDR